jgi:hypothetical protein
VLNKPCGVVIHDYSKTCQPCSKLIQHKYGKRAYKNYKPEIAVLILWCRSKESFFFDELFYITKQLSPRLSRAEINKRAHGVVTWLKKRGELVGGGIKNDRRYERRGEAEK